MEPNDGRRKAGRRGGGRFCTVFFFYSLRGGGQFIILFFPFYQVGEKARMGNGKVEKELLKALIKNHYLISFLFFFPPFFFFFFPLSPLR